MLTEAQIETFVALVDEEANLLIDEDSVTQTSDALADFTSKFGPAHDIANGLHIWNGVQAAMGQPRRDVCVYDFGEFRAACAL